MEPAPKNKRWDVRIVNKICPFCILEKSPQEQCRHPAQQIYEYHSELNRLKRNEESRQRRISYFKKNGRHPAKNIYTLDARYSAGLAVRKTTAFPLLLPREFWKRLVQAGCHFCGVSLMESSGLTLRRIDYSYGYTPDNVLPCCFGCNQKRGKPRSRPRETLIK